MTSSIASRFWTLSAVPKLRIAIPHLDYEPHRLELHVENKIK